MGAIYSVTCRNKECRYHKELRMGVGMRCFSHLCNLKDALFSGEEKNPEAEKILREGGELGSGAIYLCPKCKEFISDPTIYCKTNITESPYGTVCYDVAFPFGVPTCKDCGGELQYIKNVLSSKVKCPKCEGDLKSKHVGYFD